MENILEAVEIIKKIKELGYDAVIVGGAVRDRLLGLDAYDIDIATSMPIDLIKNNFKTLDNGSTYLSVTILIGSNQYEITSYRIDKDYADHRHPSVELVKSFRDDSNRRDFTINALAYNERLEVIDYHDGLRDLNNRLIRCIGNPNKRFNEDALRILRGLYLASKINFNIEDKTLEAMINNKRLLATLSEERLSSYFYRIIGCSYDKGIEYINKFDLFEYIPIYKRWLQVPYKGLSKAELIYSYYIKYNELPVNLAREKRICNSLKSLIDNNFSSYSLYSNMDAYKLTRHALEANGYNVKEIDNRLASLKIKSDRELALSKEEISAPFEGKNKSIMIKRVIEAVLDGTISNTREDILNFIGRRF